MIITMYMYVSVSSVIINNKTVMVHNFHKLSLELWRGDIVCDAVAEAPDVRLWLREKKNPRMQSELPEGLEPAGSSLPLSRNRSFTLSLVSEMIFFLRWGRARLRVYWSQLLLLLQKDRMRLWILLRNWSGLPCPYNNWQPGNGINQLDDLLWALNKLSDSFYQ